MPEDEVFGHLCRFTDSNVVKNALHWKIKSVYNKVHKKQECFALSKSNFQTRFG